MRDCPELNGNGKQKEKTQVKEQANANDLNE